MTSDGVKRLVGGAVVAVLVVGAVAYSVSRKEPTAVQGLAPAGDQPFGDGETLEGARRAVFSDTGGRLAVVRDDGLALAQRGQFLPITARGSNVVDAAWFGNGATLLVAEGPVPTGALAVVDLDGKVRGSIPLTPSIGFGSGHGMTVAPGGRQAVVTAVDRPVLDQEQRRLVVVDLETGTTRDLTAPGGPDEFRPFYLDKQRVAFTEVTGDGPSRALVIEVATGEIEEVAVGSAVAGTIDDDIVLLDERGRLVRAAARQRILATVPRGSALSTIDPSGSAAVVAETADRPDGSRFGRLRRIELAPTPAS